LVSLQADDHLEAGGENFLLCYSVLNVGHKKKKKEKRKKKKENHP
jgi:hypothetical protein